MSGAHSPCPGRRLHCLSVVLAIACHPSSTVAGDHEAPTAGRSDNPFYVLDTKNLFGFLEGSDVGEKGDKSLEFETTGSSGKVQCLYDSIEHGFIFENTLTDSLGLELGADVLDQDIRRVPALPNFVGFNFKGVSAEFRYMMVQRTADIPIQVTLTVQPEWNSIADAGQRTVDFSATDLPLKFHPAAIRASADFTSSGAGGATCDRRSWSGLRSRSHVAWRLAA
jgi:hypothetical protein